MIARSSLYSSLSTSRGAGNTLRRCHGDIETNIVYLPIYLESGRKQIPLLFLDLVTVKYRYLSTSRGAGNVLTPSSIKAISSKYISLSTSGGAGNGTPSRFSALSLPCVYLPIYLGRGRKHYRISTYFLVNFSRIATYLPREGPETRPHEFLLQDQKLCIDTYLPREGPETDLLLSNVFKNSV